MNIAVMGKIKEDNSLSLEKIMLKWMFKVNYIHASKWGVVFLFPCFQQVYPSNIRYCYKVFSLNTQC